MTHTFSVFSSFFFNYRCSNSNARDFLRAFYSFLVILERKKRRVGILNPFSAHSMSATTQCTISNLILWPPLPLGGQKIWSKGSFWYVSNLSPEERSKQNQSKNVLSYDFTSFHQLVLIPQDTQKNWTQYSINKLSKNGLKIIGTTNNEIPTTSLLLTLNGGHRLDAYDPSKSGLASLTASMLNESTEKYSSEDIWIF